MSPRTDPDARAKWKSAWRLARCYGVVKDMPIPWLKQSNIFRYLAYMRLMDREWPSRYDVPAPLRLIQRNEANRILDEILGVSKEKQCLKST